MSKEDHSTSLSSKFPYVFVNNKFITYAIYPL